jgi:transcriptional regulator with XRE-family HTH domain
MSTSNSSRPEQVLADRLNTLYDVVAAEGGVRYTFPQISEAMAERGVHISRARWSYMRAGTGPMTTDTPLLEALADFFGVPVSYLTEEDSEVPERVQAQLDLLRSLREAEVKTFAARSLTQELSTETLLEIREIIDRTLNKQGTEA